MMNYIESDNDLLDAIIEPAVELVPEIYSLTTSHYNTNLHHCTKSDGSILIQEDVEADRII